MAVAVVPLCGETEKQIHIKILFTQTVTEMRSGDCEPWLQPVAPTSAARRAAVCEPGNELQALWPRRGDVLGALLLQAPPTLQPHQSGELSSLLSLSTHWLHPDLNLTWMQRSFVQY